MHEVAPENAAKMLDWLAHRGGVAVWESVNLSNLGASWSTPARTDTGAPTPRPTWQAAMTPSRVITDAREIVVVARREVKRFRVALRRGAQSLSIKLTEASGRRLRAALEKAGDDASYHFDYETQEAVITVPAGTTRLDVWGKQS